MKRTVLKWGVALAACASVFYFGACGETEFDGREDTVLTLDAPRVTAKAYPGRNIVSWEPVTGAQGYVVYVYEAGLYKDYRSVSGSTSCIADFSSNLVNNTEYTYYVEATSDSNPARAAREVVVQNSRGSASVKAIVPPVGTKSLDLAAYENGYDGKTVKTLDTTKDEYALTKDRVKLELDAKSGQFYVDFPMKAYLKYTVKYYKTSIDHVLPTEGGKKTWSTKSNNVTGHNFFNIEDGGTYEVAIVAESYNKDVYPTSEEIVVGKFEVKKLELDTTIVNVRASYLYNSLNDKTIRVKFNQLKKTDGSIVPASWYKVYRRVEGEYEATLVAATINSNSESDGYNDGRYHREDEEYYLDDIVPDVTVRYVYTVVVTDGEAYASSLSSYKTLPVDVKTNKNISVWSVEGSQAKELNRDGLPVPVGNAVEWEISHTNVARSAIKAYVLVKNDDRYIDYGYLNSEIETKGKNVTDSITTKEGYPRTYFLKTSNLTTSTSSEWKEAYLLVVVNESGKDEYRIVGNTGFWTNF